MGLWSKITGEFIDIVEWLDSSRDTMVWRFPREGNEIKNGAQLVVRESQSAVFINEGNFADMFLPGTYTLTTQNLPILSTLKGWKHGFNSPFKAEVYFVSMRSFTDMKFGTKNPIMLRDPEFGPIRLRAFGSYDLKITDPVLFLREIVGTDGDFTTDKIDERLRNIMVSRFADVLGESKIPALDMAANYDEMGDFVRTKCSLDFNSYGLELMKVAIENISLPPEVEKMLDKRTSMGILGNLDQYTKFQAANAIEESGKHGGGMSDGMSMGMGMAMANQMANQMNPGGGQGQTQAGQNTPPPLPPSSTYFVAVNGQQTGPFDMNTLKNMALQGQFSRSSQVWKQGMAGWLPAEQVPELMNSVLGAVPPPPPMG